jgi:CCR4-NOT transcription complex subunit 1
LARICQLSELVSRDVFRWLSAHEETYVLNVSTIFALVSVGLVDLVRIDMVLAKFVNLRKVQALTVLAELMDLVLFSEAPIALRADFASSLEVMNQWLGEDPTLELAHLINNRLRDSGVPEVFASAPDDKALMKKEQMQYIFKEWIKMYQNSGSTERLQASFLKTMHQKQVINNQEDSAIFFRLCIDLCVDAFDQEAESPSPSLDNAYIHTDGLAKLIICLIKLQGEPNGAVKIRKGPYLKSILSIIVLVGNHHQVMRGVHFNQRVFYRLFSSLLCEYSINGLQRTAENEEMMLVFAETFLALQPAHIPGFAYGWLALVSHRGFMPGLLHLTSEAGWERYSQLLQVMLRYIGELLKVPGIQVAEHLYKGALRIMLLLHSDFPEFLAENYVQLCNAIPAHCTQLRNLVLCALPQSIAELPDQFTTGLKVDRLDEMKKAPIIAGNILAPLERDDLKDVIEKALQKGSNLDDGASQICQILCDHPSSQVDSVAATGSVDMSELNAVVLHIGQEALALSPVKFGASSPHSELLCKVAQTLRPEPRYQFLHAVANHIRYPNTHTNYFCKALLHIFGTERVDQQESEIRQQIVCVILERLIGHRPHPWGISIVIMELDRNPNYKFWDLPFMAAAPDVRHQLSRIFKGSH